MQSRLFFVPAQLCLGLPLGHVANVALDYIGMTFAINIAEKLDFPDIASFAFQRQILVADVALFLQLAKCPLPGLKVLKQSNLPKLLANQLPAIATQQFGNEWVGVENPARGCVHYQHAIAGRLKKSPEANFRHPQAIRDGTSAAFQGAESFRNPIMNGIDSHKRRLIMITPLLQYLRSHVAIAGRYWLRRASLRTVALRIFLKHASTGRFLDTAGRWTSELGEAATFRTLVDAFDFGKDHNGDRTYTAIRLRDVGRDLELKNWV
jgi:hypothetical protein